MNNTNSTIRDKALEWYKKIPFLEANKLVNKYKKFIPSDDDIQEMYLSEHPEQAGKEESQYNSKEGFTSGEWAIRDLEIIGPIGSNKSICEITGNFMDEGEAEANARLIAQAPAMYRALKDLHWACMMDSDIPTAWWKKHKETVAKAKDILNRIDNK